MVVLAIVYVTTVAFEQFSVPSENSAAEPSAERSARQSRGAPTYNYGFLIRQPFERTVILALRDKASQGYMDQTCAGAVRPE